MKKLTIKLAALGTAACLLPVSAQAANFTVDESSKCIAVMAALQTEMRLAVYSQMPDEMKAQFPTQEDYTKWFMVNVKQLDEKLAQDYFTSTMNVLMWKSELEQAMPGVGPDALSAKVNDQFDPMVADAKQQGIDLENRSTSPEDINKAMNFLGQQAVSCGQKLQSAYPNNNHPVMVAYRQQMENARAQAQASAAPAPAAARPAPPPEPEPDPEEEGQVSLPASAFQPSPDFDY
ncbi:hypothetical protein [Parvularcula sp. IMCC14364]|uniref:hypothetical protein n=1 Tax=Parvularcula sp. IMCC14364 TaxID=3067902 RepID=UPI00274291BC|nr:hypothetical protein [Parvularcula sp. IMCC14364]